MGRNNAPGPDANGRALRGVRARHRGQRQRGVLARGGCGGWGRRAARLHASALQQATRAARLHRQGLLCAQATRARLARLRRRPSQTHLQRGLPTPPVRRARDALRRHPLPTLLRQERGRLVPRAAFRRPSR